MSGRHHPQQPAGAGVTVPSRRAARLVLVTELRRRVLDRSAVVTSFVAPLVMAVIIGAAFGGGRSDQPVHVGLVVVDPTPAVEATVAAGLGAAGLAPQVSVVRVDGAARLRSEVAAGTLQSGVVVPAGFASPASVAAALGAPAGGDGHADPGGTPGAAAADLSGPLRSVVAAPGRGPRPARVTVVASSGAGVGEQTALGLASAISSRLYAGVLSAMVGGERASAVPGASATAPPADLAAVAAARTDERVAVRLVTDAVGARTSAIGYFAPSMGVVFLFIGAGLGARAITAERAGGTLARLAAAPVRSGAVVAGKMLAVLCASLASMLLLWGETVLLFGASWGDAPAVAVMCVAVTVSMTSLALFFTSLARDPEQAFVATILVGFVLGLLGGNFFPPGSMPTVLQDLSLATPNGWAMVGFGRLSVEGLGLHAVVGPVLVLGAISAVFGVASVRRIGQVVQL